MNNKPQASSGVWRLSKIWHRASVYSTVGLFAAASISSMSLLAITTGGAYADSTDKPVATKSTVAAKSVDDAEQLKLAYAAYLKGETDLAKKHLAMALDANPKNWQAQYLVSLILGQAGEFDLSVEHAGKCLALKPDYGPAYSVLGRSLAGLKSLPAAKAALEKACALEPNSAIHRYNLAAVYGMSGNYTAAYNSYKRATEIAPKYVNAYIGMGSCLGKMKDPKGQLAALQKACEVAPGSAIAHAKLGLLLSESGDVTGGLREGFSANALRIKDSWNDFLGMFLTAWACVFLAFAGLFAVIFFGSKFKPQEGENLIRSFFLTFYKDKPGRFVVTDQRLVFVPEAFSAWFGSTNVSIQRGQIESINYLSTVGGGTVSVLTRDQSVHQFRMPLLVLDPLRSLLVSQGIVSKDPEDVSKSKEKSSDASTETAAPTADASAQKADQTSAEASKETTSEESKDQSEKPQSEPEKSEESAKDSASEPEGEDKKNKDDEKIE
ncbi:MAG: hypothetical protein IPP57_05455 [Candidatus Obscuribacter sp.]|jgi:tetratricopeptide (TPR) repeat protein|nr:hypothetical protein [Candidatus Obscuribacter sp.]MBK9770262.1 hypothetical protein [Candidatus Obscuribacter sp.]MDQ5965544.1 hypothetical protein [Cyanobacteriota bacterium erpe_2018_sw_39hr_WHONDRS-SW48-000098_B_bin.30]